MFIEFFLHSMWFKFLHHWNDEVTNTCEATKSNHTAQCKFPFEYKGKVYHTCTYDHSKFIGGKSTWCATKTETDSIEDRDQMVDWGECPSDCKNDLSAGKLIYMII